MTASPTHARRLPVGAEPVAGGGTSFRVWAPRCRKVEVVLQDDRVAGPYSSVELSGEEGGYFSGYVAGAKTGDLYRYRLDARDPLVPDPASRFQPTGPHGPSQIVDPAEFHWADKQWPGVRIEGQIIYEMHIGTFTQEGTWQAAMRQLKELRDIGITVLEIMPVSEFAGRFGWGYDGVDLFAPTHLYGEPDDFRRFVDACHRLGLGVILDVVYNHFGPDGNYVNQFSDDYCSDRYKTDWGKAINYDGEQAGPVREFFISNAGYWIDEYHLDGLRLDATQNIYDTSARHVISEITQRARAAARERSVIIVAENEPQRTKLARPIEAGGYGVDALWNDDFHHTARVALTGQRDAYYTDYTGTPQELISATKWGYLFQGQYYRWQKRRRGTPSFGLKPATFVNYLENHDQISNTGYGLRLDRLSPPGCYRALSALLLLGPATPLLFQGQEFAASSPWNFFADHKPELAAKVRLGRMEFLSQFPGLRTPAAQADVPDPCAIETFQACKLDFSERERHSSIYHLHRDLIALRREDPVFRSQTGRLEGAILGTKAFLLRFFSDAGDRLLIINLDIDLDFDPAPEPLLAPPENGEWSVVWSSENPRYGGRGEPRLSTERNWVIPGPAAMVLAATKEAQG